MEDEVREKLRSGIYIIKRKKGQAAKSNVWDRFSEIVAAGDNSSIGYVKCSSCEKRLFSFELQCLVCLFNGRGCGAGRVVKIDTVVRGGLGRAK
jgi:hypothetical protein